MSETLKIVWPIDATQRLESADRSIHRFLEILGHKANFEIQPVCVLSADFFTTSHYFEPVDLEGLKTNMIRHTNEYLRDFTGFKMRDVVLLENHIASQSAEVQIFNEYIKEEMPDFVMMSSHGRKGLQRYFIGSFTESFLMHSPVPVVVIGPENVPSHSLDRALLPVELNDSSKRFVTNFLQQNHLPFLQSITLFHKITMVDLEDISWASSLYGVGDFETSELARRALDSTTYYFEDLMANLKAARKLNYEIAQGVDSVAEVIIQQSKNKNYDLIIIKSEAGPIASRVLGSVTRTVVRNSQVPVLVFPYHYKNNIN